MTPQDKIYLYNLAMNREATVQKSDYPHLVKITVCPLCGKYKPRQALTCGYHPELSVYSEIAEVARAVQIIEDYETALANAAKHASGRSLKPAKPQLPADHGLFSDEANQLDLIEMFMEPTNDY